MVASDLEWSHGSGEEIRGPLHALLEAIAVADLPSATSRDGHRAAASRFSQTTRQPPPKQELNKTAIAFHFESDAIGSPATTR